ncbi:MAG: extracellular solute-binding protein [Clostridia bacterium]|nr:extracellular solute-binding protein [Clostridia bacterium]
MKFDLKKIVALIMVFAMVLCFAGCDNGGTTSSYYEEVPGENGGDNGGSTGNNATQDIVTEVPTNLKGTTVKVLFWRPLTNDEKAVVASFEKQTGMKVQFKFAANAGGVYAELISASLAAKEGYDIAMFNNINFPGRPTSIMQPLNDIKGFDFSDPAWDKALMDTQKINGKYYGVNIVGGHTNEFVAMYFNETMFKNRGVKTPRQLWEAGNWNWDTFLDAAKAMTYKENGAQVYGYINRGTGYMTYWLQAAGTDFITYDGTKFKSNLSDAKLLNNIKYYNEFRTKYKIMGDDTYGVPHFRSGEAAMFSVITYAMFKESDTKFSQMSDTIDAVPFPMPKGQKQVALVDSCLFGILKGAKNSEGAAHFLRYFLDPQNYSMSDNFINKNLEKTFNELAKMDKRVSISEGVVNNGAQVDFANVCHNIVLTDAAQVTSKVKSYATNFDFAVNKANKAVK